MVLRNRDLVAGSFVCSRTGNMFLIIEVVPLSRFYVGLRYASRGRDGVLHVDYSEEKRSGVFLMDCLFVRPREPSV